MGLCTNVWGKTPPNKEKHGDFRLTLLDGMKKIVLYSVAWYFLFFTVFMCMVKKEGRISFAVGNNWAASKFPDEQPLRFIRLRSSEAPDPEEGLYHLEGQRWHSGFPCWALYIDAGTIRNVDASTIRDSGLNVWYAKLDIYKTLANWFIGFSMGIGCSLLQCLIRPQRAKKILYKPIKSEHDR